MEKFSKTEKISLFIINKIVGTFQFFIFCNILSFIGFLLPKLIPTVQFISSGWLQLIFLPLMLISAVIQSKQDAFTNEKHYQTLLRHEEKIDKLLKTVEKSLLTKKKSSTIKKYK